jgi:hypothetical protein
VAVNGAYAVSGFRANPALLINSRVANRGVDFAAITEERASGTRGIPET